jgi:hypothetical protein
MSKYIICIDKGDCDNITIGKKYEVITSQTPKYVYGYGLTYEYFIGDDDNQYSYTNEDKLFISLEDWRKFQIEKLKI